MCVQPLPSFDHLDVLIVIYSVATPSSTHLAQQDVVYIILFFFFNCLQYCTVTSDFFPKATVRGILSVPQTYDLDWDLPGGPVVKIPCFQCREYGFHPWSGN